MRNASDPVLRQKAEALSYLGMTVYGMATYYAMNDKITGYKTKIENIDFHINIKMKMV